MPVSQPPTGPVRAVIEWVGDDVARAALALQIEQGRDRPRKTIVGPLSELIENAPSEITLGEIREQLGVDLVKDAVRLRGQMFAPAVEKVAIKVKAGLEREAVDVFEVHRDQPTFAEQRTIAQTIAIVLEQAEQLAGGDTSTEAVGILDELDARRQARRSAAADQAAASGERR